MTTSNKPHQAQAISFQTFGEKTNIPIKVKEAKFNLSHHHESLNILRRSLLFLELTAQNDSTNKNISGKIRVSLPVGASVKKFEFQKTQSQKCNWYPATAVPKKKSKEVVYKEKELGRDVAAVSDVGGGSNIFEIDISPLEYQVDKKFRMEILIPGGKDDVMDFVMSCFSSPEEETKVIITENDNDEKNKCDEDQEKNDFDDLKINGGALVGDCFGKNHFVCRVPSVLDILVNHGGTRDDLICEKIERIGVVWDNSASMNSSNEILEKRFDCFRELSKKCNEELKNHDEKKEVTFEFYTFGCGKAVFKGSFQNVEGLIEAMRLVQYDGGTDMTTLTELICDFAGRSDGDGQIDSVMVFTDGMDNLGCSPDFGSKMEDTYNIRFPVHCIADGNEVNMTCLNTIASVSPTARGFVFTGKDETYVSGVLNPKPIITSIKTDQEEDAFIQDVDDGFRCVPDHRVGVLSETVGLDGAIISGILDCPSVGQSSVSKITAEVTYGTRRFDFHFHLRGEYDSSTGEDNQHHSHSFEKYAQHFTAIQLPTTSVGTSTTKPDPNRILGYIYAEELYNAAVKFGLKSGLDVTRVKEDIAIEYGFCSPESSLLMLYTKDQFLDNDILPPLGHPVYDDCPDLLEKRNKREQKDSVTTQQKRPNDEDSSDEDSSDDEDDRNQGQIGKLKTIEQNVKVVELAKRLDKYFSEEKPLKRKKKGIFSSRRLLSRSSARRNEEEVDLRTRVSGARSLARRNEEEVDLRTRVSGASRPPPAARAAMCDAYSEDEDDEADEADEAVMMEGRYCCVGGADSEVSPRSHSQESMDNRDSQQFNRHQLNQATDPKGYTERIEKALITKHLHDGEEWKRAYLTERNTKNNAKSPSFFISCARLILKHDMISEAIKIVSNCLEINIDDVQMLRCVGYFLLSTNDNYALELALAIFDHVEELEPCEPQSFLDGALARFWMTWKEAPSLSTTSTDRDDGEACWRSKLEKCQKLIVHVLTHQWADRFSEIEWPALILLHIVADFIKELNKKKRNKDSSFLLSEWPNEDLSCFDSEQTKIDDVFSKGFPLFCDKFDLVLMVWLGWDTDKTDIDLHIIEPSKNEVYYGNKASNIGSHLSRDFTQGYGPEVYVLKEDSMNKKDGKRNVTKGKLGEYNIFSKYFASHQDSALTGTTSAVLWTYEKRGKGGKKIEFHNVRLDTQKEKTKVGSIHVLE